MDDIAKQYTEKCRECGGELKIIGTGNLGDTILVECQSCGDIYELEPDGLGEGGLEMVDALMVQVELDQEELA